MKHNQTRRMRSSRTFRTRQTRGGMFRQRTTHHSSGIPIRHSRNILPYRSKSNIETNLETLFPSFPEQVPLPTRAPTSVNAIKSKLYEYTPLRNKYYTQQNYIMQTGRKIRPGMLYYMSPNELNIMMANERNIYQNIETLRTIPEIALTNDEREFLEITKGVKRPEHLRNNFQELIDKEREHQAIIDEKNRFRELIALATPLIKAAYKSYYSMWHSDRYSVHPYSSHPEKNYLILTAYDNFPIRKQELIDSGITKEDMIKMGLKELTFLLERTEALGVGNPEYLRSGFPSSHGAIRPHEWSYYESKIPKYI